MVPAVGLARDGQIEEQGLGFVGGKTGEGMVAQHDDG